jgi:Undecaprenyl-phosphate glucose phosphotransferase
LVKQKHQLFVTFLSLADAGVVVVACYLSWVIRRFVVEQPLVDDWATMVKEPLAIIAAPLTVLMLVLFGVYQPRRDRSVWVEQRQVIKASLASIVAIIIMLWVVGGDAAIAFKSAPSATFFGQPVDAGRVQLVTLAMVQTFFLCLHRLIFRGLLRSIRRRGWNLRHVAVIGVGRLGRIVCRTLERNTWTGIEVAYFISHRDTTRRSTILGKPVLGGLDNLEEVLNGQKPDAVYLAIPNARAAELPRLLKQLEKFAVEVRIVPDVHPRYLPQSMVVSELDGMPVLSYRENPHHGLGGFGKRTVDLVGAIIAIVLFSPLMALISLLVRVSSPGPVIFAQTRVGLGGETFRIYKFRTMYHAEDEAGEATWTARHDPRVTPVGKWLRRMSLDELPQLFNVLLGDMSLVGPRPERPELIAQFKENWRGYILRQHVKAGITGWAQVNGLRGDTDLRKRLQLDLFYIRHWSIGFDFKILWLTIFRGFVHPNAH